MKVLLVNGSPHEKGCTYTALSEVAKALNGEGVAAEFFWVGLRPVSGCISCRKCAKTGRCAIDDAVNVFLDAAGSADGFIFGSPVHYAAASGAMTSFMDRAFFADRGWRGSAFYMKPAAAVISARRAGATAAFDQMNKYFTISQMPVVSSRYWNMVHGSAPEDVRKDAEGMYTMRVLGRNMAYILKCLEAGAKAGNLAPPEIQIKEYERQ